MQQNIFLNTSTEMLYEVWLWSLLFTDL